MQSLRNFRPNLWGTLTMTWLQMLCVCFLYLIFHHLSGRVREVKGFANLHGSSINHPSFSLPSQKMTIIEEEEQY